jgi:hypothetical protein
VPHTFTPIGNTGRLDQLRSQAFTSGALRSQLAVNTVLRSTAHPCWSI